MTQRLYIDTHAGIAGDMMLAALLDAGADVAVLRQAIDEMGLDDVALEVTRVQKRGIAAQHVHVVHGEQHPHRGLSDVLAVADRVSLTDRARDRVVRTFTALAEAEASVHGVDVEAVHFHEVGAVDAIVDVVGTAVLLDSLDIGRVHCGPVRTGKGTVTCAHGVLPVPAPATARLLAGVPTFAGDVDGEFCTPTGAALLKGLAAQFGPRPLFVHDAVGHGAGTRDPGFANLIRVFVGADTDGIEGLRRETVVELSTNIDDMTPEAYAHLEDVLRQDGVLDVSSTPLSMKKGRGGQRLHVLCRPPREAAVVGLMMRHSSTLGVRRQTVERWVRHHDVALIDTPFGPIEGKRVDDGRFFPEFEACRSAAQEHGVSVDEVMAAAKAGADQNPKTG